MIIKQFELVWLLIICTCISCSAPNQTEERWCDRLPRPIYETLQRVDVGNDWFEVYLVEEGVYAIYEPYQWQEVISYLILGEHKALLFDSGNGIERISKVTTALTDQPVVVLNSHTHFDHIGGNFEFDQVLAMDTEYTRKSSTGMDNSDIRAEASEQALCIPLPDGLSSDTHKIASFEVTQWIGDGHVIDLGGRELEVLSIPGHTPDAIALLDKDKGLLWTGDTFYEGPIWLFVEETDLAAYGRSIDRLVELSSDIKRLLPAHNTPLADPAILVEVQSAFSTVQSGKVAGELRSEGRIEYFFEGFSFLMLRN